MKMALAWQVIEKEPAVVILGQVADARARVERSP